MYCKYLSKSINGKLKCKFKRQVITLLSCQNCSDFILVRNKGIKKVSKNKVVVKKEIYQKVYNRDKVKCKLCGTSLNLHLHHIIYRSEDKKLINEPDNCIMLCINCHQKVHSNKHYWQSILKEIIKNNG